MCLEFLNLKTEIVYSKEEIAKKYINLVEKSKLILPKFIQIILVHGICLLFSVLKQKIEESFMFI